jgi:hypothetical protein
MHLNLDELLALRDGEGTVETERHVAGCESCRAEIGALRAASNALRALPSSPPPQRSWAIIRRRIINQRRRPVDKRLGIAVAIFLALAAAAVVGRIGTTAGSFQPASTDDTRVAIEQLSIASRELERVLQDSSLRSPVLSTREAAMIVEIEDWIALVDLALVQDTHNRGERAVALWSDRVELLDALVTARGGDVRTDGVVVAINREKGSQQ